MNFTLKNSEFYKLFNDNINNLLSKQQNNYARDMINEYKTKFDDCIETNNLYQFIGIYCECLTALLNQQHHMKYRIQ